MEKGRGRGHGCEVGGKGRVGGGEWEGEGGKGRVGRAGITTHMCSCDNLTRMYISMHPHTMCASSFACRFSSASRST